jgi:hypothetical protein
VLPFVYSVRADGEVLGVIAGPKAQGAVDAMLRDGIAKSGRVLQAGEAAKLASALEKAKAANERGDAAQALALLAPASKGEGFAEVLVESRKLLAEIHKLAADDLAAAEKDLAESGELLPVAVKIVEAGKKYARLPEQKKAQTALVRKLGQKENGRAALAQAEDIVRARGLASSEKPDRAVQAYEQIVKKYPDTPAAALANEELAALKNK